MEGGGNYDLGICLEQLEERNEKTHSGYTVFSSRLRLDTSQIRIRQSVPLNDIVTRALCHDVFSLLS